MEVLTGPGVCHTTQETRLGMIWPQDLIVFILLTVLHVWVHTQDTKSTQAVLISRRLSKWHLNITRLLYYNSVFLPVSPVTSINSSVSSPAPTFTTWCPHLSPVFPRSVYTMFLCIPSQIVLEAWTFQQCCDPAHPFVLPWISEYLASPLSGLFACLPAFQFLHHKFEPQPGTWTFCNICVLKQICFFISFCCLESCFWVLTWVVTEAYHIQPIAAQFYEVQHINQTIICFIYYQKYIFFKTIIAEKIGRWYAVWIWCIQLLYT